MASAPNPFTAENLTLQDAFSALYYRSIPPSLIAARAQELGYLLFGEKGLKHFEAAQNGHFSYQDPDGFVHPFLRVPNNKAEVMAIWEKWAAKKNEQIERHFHKANYKIPPLFGGNLQLRSIEPVFAPQDTSSVLSALDSKHPQYWKLFFQIELPALELKRSSKLWQDLKEGTKTLADYIAILRPEALESIVRLAQKTVLQGESVTVYIGKQHDIIRMEYQHLPILDRIPTDLLVPVNLQTEGLFRTTHSGTQSLFSERSRTELAGISMLHRRHSETQEITPFWNGGGAASRRGIEVEIFNLKQGYYYLSDGNLVDYVGNTIMNESVFVIFKNIEEKSSTISKHLKKEDFKHPNYEGDIYQLVNVIIYKNDKEEIKTEKRAIPHEEFLNRCHWIYEEAGATDPKYFFNYAYALGNSEKVGLQGTGNPPFKSFEAMREILMQDKGWLTDKEGRLLKLTKEGNYEPIENEGGSPIPIDSNGNITSHENQAKHVKISMEHCRMRNWYARDFENNTRKVIYAYVAIESATPFSVIISPIPQKHVKVISSVIHSILCPDNDPTISKGKNGWGCNAWGANHYFYTNPSNNSYAKNLIK